MHGSRLFDGEAVQQSGTTRLLQCIVAASGGRMRRIPRREHGNGIGWQPVRSMCPTKADPRRSWSSCRRSCRRCPGTRCRSRCVPVSTSCMLGVSPRPFTTAPFSVNDVCLVRLLLACSSSTLVATTTPFTFLHGPVPILSFALTAGVDACRRRTQIGAPSPVAQPHRCGERLAMLVRARKAAEIGTLAAALAGDEKAGAALRRAGRATGQHHGKHSRGRHTS